MHNPGGWDKSASRVASPSFSPDSPSLPAPLVPCAAARALRMPRWKLARRSCARVADRPGAGGEGAVAVLLTVPGTRFAFGTRTGSPAAVVPPDTGACATSAARQPSSAGEDQVSAGVPAVSAGAAAVSAGVPAVSAGAAAVSAGTPVADRSAPCLLRRNQSDSTDSKIGSRLSSAALGTSGVITSGVISSGVITSRDRALASEASMASPGLGARSSSASAVVEAPDGSPSTGTRPLSGAGGVAVPESAEGIARSAGEPPAAVPVVSNRRSPGGTPAVS
jgi:mucin-6/19